MGEKERKEEGGKIRDRKMFKQFIVFATVTVSGLSISKYLLLLPDFKTWKDSSRLLINSVCCKAIKINYQKTKWDAWILKYFLSLIYRNYYKNQFKVQVNTLKRNQKSFLNSSKHKAEIGKVRYIKNLTSKLRKTFL